MAGYAGSILYLYLHLFVVCAHLILRTKDSSRKPVSGVGPCSRPQPCFRTLHRLGAVLLVKRRTIRLAHSEAGRSLQARA
jgi:hypothetical protein